MTTRVSQPGNYTASVRTCSHYEGSQQNLGPGTLHRRASMTVEINRKAVYKRTAALRQMRAYHRGSDVLLEVDFCKETF